MILDSVYSIVTILSSDIDTIYSRLMHVAIVHLFPKLYQIIPEFIIHLLSVGM